MRQTFLSAQLAREIENRIVELEAEDQHMKDFLSDFGIGSSSSSILDSTGQIGTVVPRYFAAMDTFIANPSNVSVGIIARMIETDPTIMSAVQFKSLMMLSKIGEYQHEEEEIADFVRAFLSRMDGPTWKESMEGQSSHGGYGFSTSEIVWGLNKQNQKVPLRVPNYHPSTIAFEVDAFGNITPNGVIQFVIQNAQIENPNQYFPYFQYGFNVKNPFETLQDRLLPYRMPFINNYGLARIPKKSVIHHICNSQLSFGSPYGKSPVRTMHLAWQLKVFMTKRLGIAGKRQASPFIWATAPHNQNQVKYKDPKTGNITEKMINPIEALTDLLSQREGDDSVVTGPESIGYKLQAIANNMDLNQYLDVLNWLDTQMFRAALLPSLVMTDGAAGSRALGDKHFQVVDRIAEEEAGKFGETIIKQMIKRAIDENFGEQDDYGHFAQRPQNIEERERLANMFNGLANTGFMRAYDQKDGDFVRSSLHLPEQDESFYAAAMPNLGPIDDDGSGDPADQTESDPATEGKPEPHKEDPSDPKP